MPCSPAVLPRETRAFTPHLTLYRKAQRVEPGRIDPPIRWQAESLTLACAVGGSSGAPSYRILNEWSLRQSLNESWAIQIFRCCVVPQGHFLRGKIQAIDRLLSAISALASKNLASQFCSPRFILRLPKGEAMT